MCVPEYLASRVTWCACLCLQVWNNEGSHPDRPKWGFISSTPGTHLVVKINTTIPGLAKDGNVRAACGLSPSPAAAEPPPSSSSSSSIIIIIDTIIIIIIIIIIINNNTHMLPGPCF